MYPGAFGELLVSAHAFRFNCSRPTRRRAPVTANARTTHLATKTLWHCSHAAGLEVPVLTEASFTVY